MTIAARLGFSGDGDLVFSVTLSSIDSNFSIFSGVESLESELDDEDELEELEDDGDLFLLNDRLRLIDFFGLGRFPETDRLFEVEDFLE